MTVAPSQDLAARIVKQVEFYFGDANLPRDKFMMSCVQGAADGWVALETIASFGRMKSLSEDAAVVQEAILGATSSEVIEARRVEGEDKVLVRRKCPLPESQDALAKSIYAKGFPLSATLDDLLAFFATLSPAVAAVRFRRDLKTKAFKGSVFVEFATAEEASRCAALVDVKYVAPAMEGAAEAASYPLVVKSKMAYFEDKNAERGGAKGGANGKAAALLERMGAGRLVKISDFPSEGLTHEALKGALKDTPFAIAFIDVAHEAGAAWVRFREPVAAAFVEEYGSEKALVVGEHSLASFYLPTEAEQGKFYQATAKPRFSPSGRGDKFAKRQPARRAGGDRNEEKRSAEGGDDAALSKRARLSDETPASA